MSSGYPLSAVSQSYAGNQGHGTDITKTSSDRGYNMSIGRRAAIPTHPDNQGSLTGPGSVTGQHGLPPYNAACVGDKDMYLSNGQNQNHSRSGHGQQHKFLSYSSGQQQMKRERHELNATSMMDDKGMSPLSILVNASLQDNAQLSPNPVSHLQPPSLRYQTSGNEGDAMLSAINYSDSDLLPDAGFDETMSTNLAPLDDNILNNLVPGTTELFDGEGNVSETYNMEPLSPHAFAETSANFGISDPPSLTPISSDSGLSAGTSPKSQENAVRVGKPLSPSRLLLMCNICGKSFNSSSALTKHRLTHSDERKYICMICSKAFKRQDHLNGHLMTHRQKKPFECLVTPCDKTYCDARSLRRHIENHHKDMDPELVNMSIMQAQAHIANVQASDYVQQSSYDIDPDMEPSTGSPAYSHNAYMDSHVQYSNTFSSPVQYNSSPGGPQHESPGYNNNNNANRNLSNTPAVATHYFQFETQQPMPQASPSPVALASPSQQNLPSPHQLSSPHKLPSPQFHSPSSLDQSVFSHGRGLPHQTQADAAYLQQISPISPVTAVPMPPPQQRVKRALVSEELKPVECTICNRRFKNIPALNGHMRLHGGYFKKDKEEKKQRKVEREAAAAVAASQKEEQMFKQSYSANAGSAVQSPSEAFPITANLIQMTGASVGEVNQETMAHKQINEILQQHVHMQMQMQQQQQQSLGKQRNHDQQLMEQHQQRVEHERQVLLQQQILQQHLVTDQRHKQQTLLDPNQPNHHKQQIRLDPNHRHLEQPTSESDDSTHRNWPSDTYSMSSRIHPHSATLVSRAGDPMSLYSRDARTQPAPLIHAGLDHITMLANVAIGEFSGTDMDSSNPMSVRIAQHNPQTIMTSSPSNVVLSHTLPGASAPSDNNQDLLISQIIANMSHANSPANSGGSDHSAVAIPIRIINANNGDHSARSHSFLTDGPKVNVGSHNVVHPTDVSLAQTSNMLTENMPVYDNLESRVSPLTLPVDLNDNVRNKLSPYPNDKGNYAFDSFTDSDAFKSPRQQDLCISDHGGGKVNDDIRVTGSSLQLEQDVISSLKRKRHVSEGVIRMIQSRHPAQVGHFLTPRQSEIEGSSSNIDEIQIRDPNSYLLAAPQKTLDDKIKTLKRSKSEEHSVSPCKYRLDDPYKRACSQGDSGSAHHPSDPFSQSDSSVFRNPSLAVAVRSKKKHRPAPLIIPHYNNMTVPFYSRLRSPRIWDNGVPHRGNTPPPYTPPPMLSPIRSGSGLFWSLNTPKSAAVTPRLSFRGSISSLKDETIAEEAPPETDIQPHVNIGNNYQAVLPAYNPCSELSKREVPHEDIMWHPHVIADCSEEDVSCYQEFACCSAVKGNGFNIEYAIHLLYFNKGNVQDSILMLMSDTLKLPKHHPILTYKYQETNNWSHADIEAYTNALISNDKDFHAISKELSTKPVKDCVQFYYLWKKACPDDYKRLRYLRRRRDNGDIHTLRSQGQPEQTTAAEVAEIGESDDSHTDEEVTQHVPMETKPTQPPVVSESLPAAVMRPQPTDLPSVVTSVGPAQVPLYSCDMPNCHAIFNSKQALNGHARIHGGNAVKHSSQRVVSPAPSPVSMAAATVTVATKGRIAGVNRGVHKPPLPPQLRPDGTLEEFPCKLCGKIFHKVKSRSAHMKSHRVIDNDKKHPKVQLPTSSTYETYLSANEKIESILQASTKIRDL